MTYQMWQNVTLLTYGRVKVANIFVIAGPSGVGKTTLIKQLLEEHPEQIVHPLTYTTRNPRAGEVNGRDMNFIPRCQFTPRLLENEFIAHTEYQGELYGTLRSDLVNPAREGRKVVVAFDESGVKCLKSQNLGAVYIYIEPPSLDKVSEWLQIRWPHKGEEYDRRMLAAAAEIRRWKHDVGFKSLFDWSLVSGDLSEMKIDLKRIMGL